ncbi:MAG: class I SAM-dependent methyltransferase [Gammaproteobacteria bacterium]
MPAQESKSQLAPHGVLSKYYADSVERRTRVGEMFDASARHYDWINGVLSFGTGERYRREALVRAGLQPGMHTLDTGCGTGVVAGICADIAGPTGCCVALDPSREMLCQAIQKGRVNRAVRGTAERLPFASNRFDMLTMGYALRHVEDLLTTFSEYRRVLKPFGKVLLLEITPPESRIPYFLLKAYLKFGIPGIVRLARRSRDAQTLMSYYWDTIEHCVPPARILEALQQAGLKDASRNVEAGIFSEYTARK